MAGAHNFLSKALQYVVPAAIPGVEHYFLSLTHINGAPIVDAGPDQYFFSYGLRDDHLYLYDIKWYDPDDNYTQEGIVSGRKVSGPGHAVIDTYIGVMGWRADLQFDTFGVYELEFTYVDSYGDVGSDTVIINVLSGVPKVDAGGDTYIQCESLPCETSLDGTASDPDGSPSPLTNKWIVVSGPGNVMFTDDTQPKTSASFTAAGVYTLELSTDDGRAQASDQVEIHIELDSSPPPGSGGNPGSTVPGQNISPKVDAGADMYVLCDTLPCRISLKGTVEDPDDGPSTLVSQWRIISSSGDVTFDDDTQPDTSTTFAAAGVYILELFADDGQIQVSDQVEITIATDQSQSPDVTGDVSANLVGHWKLDGNLDDEIGSANGTFIGGILAYESGMVDQGLQFDGINDYLLLPVTQSPTAYTIAAWVKPARTDAASIIARTSSWGTAFSWSHQLRINHSGVFEHYTWDGNSRIVTGTTGIETDTWYHVVVSATNGGDVRLYVDGREEGISTTVETLWPDGDRYHVGSNSGDSMGWFEGMVDDIRVYSDVLSEFEILSTMIGEPWPYAWDATPSDGALISPSQKHISWSPGAGAVSHEVYLSDNLDYVSNSSDEAFQGNLETTSLSTTFAFPRGLVPGTTYCWRIDEVNDADPNSPRRGDIWSFTVLPEVTITDPNLIGRWTFDEDPESTVFDWSGHGNHGILRNGPQWILDGYDGGALQFDGRDDYVSVPLDVSETEYSAALWFRTTHENCGLMCVVQNDLGGGGRDRHIYLDAGRLTARIWNNEIISTDLNVADGLWHHVVHTYGVSIGGQKLYVDGVLQASGIKAQSDFDWQQRINIGFSNDAAQTHFEGLIDEVHVFDKAMTEENIGTFF